MSHAVSVSVVMPVCDGRQFLPDAVESILHQTCGDFEFIIIDDGSTDQTADLLNDYASRDSRIRVATRTRAGIVPALNHGLSLAQGEFIARMDADDVSLPDRFIRQTRYLRSHPEIVAAGTQVETFGDAPGQVWQLPTDPDLLRCRLLFSNPIAHPTVLMRRDWLETTRLRYRAEYPLAEDYDLWTRCEPNHRLANVPETLLRYRIHRGQASVRQNSLRLDSVKRIHQRLLNSLGLVPDPSELSIHEAMGNSQFPATPEFVLSADAWLRRLLEANRHSRFYPHESLMRVLTGRWVAVVQLAQTLGLEHELNVNRSPFFPYIHPGSL